MSWYARYIFCVIIIQSLKGEFFHGFVVVRVTCPIYVGHSIWNAEPILLLLLSILDRHNYWVVRDPLLCYRRLRVWIQVRQAVSWKILSKDKAANPDKPLSKFIMTILENILNVYFALKLFKFKVFFFLLAATEKAML